MVKKILVIDDSASDISLVRALLQDKKYEVVTAVNGRQGLEKARGEKPDLILLDVVMPEIDGFTMFKELKKNPRLASIPVIVVTAKKEMKEVFDMLGVEDFFVKPFNSRELLASIKAVVGDAEEAFSPETKKE